MTTLYEIAPQTARLEFGPEPTLPEIIETFYRSKGVAPDRAATFTASYITELSIRALALLKGADEFDVTDFLDPTKHRAPLKTEKVAGDRDHIAAVMLHGALESGDVERITRVVREIEAYREARNASPAPTDGIYLFWGHHLDLDRIVSISGPMEDKGMWSVRVEYQLRDKHVSYWADTEFFYIEEPTIAKFKAAIVELIAAWKARKAARG